jgi:hypothetical protein
LAGILGSWSVNFQQDVFTHAHNHPGTGWHCTIWDYRCKIHDIMRNIFSSLAAVLPINRQNVDCYLVTKSMDRIELLLHSVTPYRGRNAADLRERVKPYVVQEEEQIGGNLEAIKYEIDAQNTLTLITGQGHIERVGTYFSFSPYLLSVRTFSIYFHYYI